MDWFVVSVVVSLLSFATAAWLYLWVSKQNPGTKKTQEIGALIREGANVFLAREYRLLAYFVLVVAALILLFLPQPIWHGEPKRNLLMAAAYIAGSVFSGFAGKIGMNIATIANSRTATAATESMENSFYDWF